MDEEITSKQKDFMTDLIGRCNKFGLDNLGTKISQALNRPLTKSDGTLIISFSLLKLEERKANKQAEQLLQ